MRFDNSISRENFDKLLEWLSADRDGAAAQFEQIRTGLIRFFRLKGCSDPEMLADETMDRVTKRIDSLNLSTAKTPGPVFYGFATKVFLEYMRTEKLRTVQIGDDFGHVSSQTADGPENVGLDCLRKCLASIPDADGRLIVTYYTREKQENLELRRQLAQTNDLAMGALQTKVYRLKKTLRPCIEKCIKSKKNV